jgi:hypothetical protein
VHPEVVGEVGRTVAAVGPFVRSFRNTPHAPRDPKRCRRYATALHNQKTADHLGRHRTRPASSTRPSGNGILPRPRDWQRTSAPVPGRSQPGGCHRAQVFQGLLAFSRCCARGRAHSAWVAPASVSAARRAFFSKVFPAGADTEVKLTRKELRELLRAGHWARQIKAQLTIDLTLRRSFSVVPFSFSHNGRHPGGGGAAVGTGSVRAWADS